jgi:S-disulfanyl-L-cysteine oxidoreductase SoxD
MFRLVDRALALASVLSPLPSRRCPLALVSTGARVRGRVDSRIKSTSSSCSPLTPTLSRRGRGGSWLLAATLFGLAGTSFAQTQLPNLGRPATPAELRAWDIDVRPDFKGLPAGSGSVGKGQEVWESKCENCHGAFGESNEYFTPIIGHTQPSDSQTGNVAALRAETVPQRTSLMKLSQLSTLWDYINRAMPWNAPKSLSADEVYAVTAYILNLGNIVPADFVLSHKNIAETQKKLPNRNGATQAHAMWNVKDKPDVQGVTCVTHCAREVTIVSRLPDYARNAHGNLAEQNRTIGAIRGANTLQPAQTAMMAATTASAAITSVANAPKDDAQKLAQKHTCTACHGMTNKILGPSFADIHKKYGSDSAATLAAKIKVGGSGVWGNVPMPAQAHVPDADVRAIANWLAAGKF